MPFAGYKDFKDCERKNQDKNDPSGFCAWLRRKVEGGDPLVLSLEANKSEMLYGLYRLETMTANKLSIQLLTKEDALAVLDGDDIWKKAPSAVVNDDHRWIHVWAKTIERGDQLFISKAQLKRLHDLVVDELARRGMDSGLAHKSPLKFEALLAGDKMTAFLKNRQGFLLDPEFINLIGSSVAGKENPEDLDILLRSSMDKRFAEAFLKTIPKNLEVDLVWDPIGPNGPYVPAFELWAIPVKSPMPKEPKFTVQPMSPMIPAKPSKMIDREAAPSLFEDSYFVEPIKGMRVMIHRRENHLMAFGADLEEVELPKEITEDLSKIKDPPTFILDGFLAREKGEAVYYLIDLPWWRESEHVRQTAGTRKYFISKLLKEIPEVTHIKRNEAKFFPNRKDTIDFLSEEDGPYLLIPGLTIYPVEGSSDWTLFETKGETYKLAESADEVIKSRVDAGEWEKMDADARFSLMTKRRRIEPLYPFAQMKTTKKGYSAREVFGLTSVGDLAKDLFKVPNKQSTEVKIDGFRTEIHKKGDQVRLYTESGHEITKQLPSIVEDIKRLPGDSFVLDSESTPYSEDLTNLGRAGAAPAFAVGAKGPVDDKLWALHVFDILYLNGEDLHNLPYQERRQRLRGIELPTRDTPKEKADFRLHLWENNVYWATSAEQMVKLAEQVSDVPGSEGAMFKQADSKYRLSGNTPLWSKMKRTFEVDAIVVGANQEGNTYNYVGAIGPVDVKADIEAPVDSSKGKFVRFKGKVYSILGKTFNTNIKAPIGSIIRVTVKDIRKIDDKVYHWFHPQVLEAREDKTRPDPLETAQTISESAKAQQRVRKGAFLSSARFAEESPIKCCLAPWVALEGEEGWQYLENNAALPSSLKQLGVEVLYASSMDRDLAEKLLEAGVSFELTDLPTIADFKHRAYTESDWPPESVTIDPEELKAFEASVWSHQDAHMKLNCGSGVPMPELNPLKLADPYVIYPEESKKWKYVVQFHIRGLSVHADFRAEINERQLIGWTLNLGKSLIKPLLRRVSDETLSAVGLTKGQLKDMEISELSAKLRSTKEGKELIGKLSQKTQDLPYGELEKIANEIWEEEAKPILENPNMKILTEKKAPEPHEWLNYRGEIPAGAVGATAELEGVFIIMDKGDVQFGAQKPWFHEYFLKGERMSGKMVVRQLPTRKEWQTKQSFAWLTFFTKPGDMPYVISRRAIQQDWMPPQGISSLPREIRDQIPEDRQYWRAKNAKEIRDELVKEIGGKKVALKLAKGLQFAVKRVWHKGPEVQRGTPIVRYWILFHDGSKVIDAWDFGEDSDPTEEVGILVRRRAPKGFEDLLPTTGELPAIHPASYTKKLPNNFDTSDQGKAEIVSDENDMLRVRLNGQRLKGLYVFLKRDPSGEGWVFQRAELPEPKKAMLLQAATCETGICSTTHIMHLGTSDFKYEKIGNLLFLNGPAIKPGEVIPMDGKPCRFTKEGIKKLWPSMYRQPIVVLHGDLKGDVIGFVDKIHYDEETGWGWIDRGVIWHSLGMKMIMEGKLPAFSIEVIPESVWDPEHQHDVVMGGQCVGLAVVPKGACVTCNYKEAVMGELIVKPNEVYNGVYKFGMTLVDYLQELYWNQGLSTQIISDREGIPRSTVEHYMEKGGIPRRSYPESRQLRTLRESEVRRFGGRVKITALGTGAFSDIPRDDCPQCQEARKGGKSKRNYTATLFSVGNEHLLINTPKGVSGMLGLRQIKPKHVLIEHIHEDVIGGLHELKALRPNVFASAETWAWLRDHHQVASGQKGDFEEIYAFPRYMIKAGQGFSIAEAFTVTPYEVGHAKEGDPSAYGFKIDLGGKKVWHSSDVLSIPNHKELLKDIDLYIGDGASLTRGIPGGGQEYGHASMEDQIKWAEGVQKIYFTQIGHVGLSHDQLKDKLDEMAPNAEPMHDGMEISLGGATAGAHMSEKAAQELLSGQRKILVRSKPYSEYARQVILLLGDKVHALFIEGFPEGPLDASKVKTMKSEHRMTEAEWKKEIGDVKKVWVYRPRILKRFEPPRDYESVEPAGPYIHDVKMMS